MPLRPHQGLPGSTVIPTDWAATHARVVERTYDCHVLIRPRGGTPTFDPDTGTTRTVPAVASYDGPASIGLVSTSDGTRVEVAEDQVTERTYEVKLLTADADPVTVDQLVRVVSCPNPRLVGRALRITSVGVPGREFSRVIYAVLDD